MTSLDHLVAHEVELCIGGKTYKAVAPTLEMYGQITGVVRQNTLRDSDQAARLNNMPPDERRALWADVASREIGGEDVAKAMTRPEIIGKVLFVLCKKNHPSIHPDVFMRLTANELAELGDKLSALFDPDGAARKTMPDERPTEEAQTTSTTSHDSSSITA